MLQNNTSGQVYYDAKTGQYYTSGPTTSVMGHSVSVPNPAKVSELMAQGYSYRDAADMARRNYLNGGIGGAAPSNQSQVAKMLAARQPYQYNAPSAQQFFPGMGNPMMGTMPTQAQGNPMFSGNFGAGRFLGQGYANQSGLLGSSSTSMLGS